MACCIAKINENNALKLYGHVNSTVSSGWRKRILEWQSQKRKEIDMLSSVNMGKYIISAIKEKGLEDRD